MLITALRTFLDAKWNFKVKEIYSIKSILSILSILFYLFYSIYSILFYLFYSILILKSFKLIELVMEEPVLWKFIQKCAYDKRSSCESGSLMFVLFRSRRIFRRIFSRRSKKFLLFITKINMSNTKNDKTSSAPEQ